jgi:uncharacterized delta-60 repeat protein
MIFNNFGFNTLITTFAAAPVSTASQNYGGDFTAPTNRLARYKNGVVDNSYNIGSGFNSGVTSLAVQQDGKLLVGGGFTTYSGSTQNNLVRLNTDGTTDTSFNVGTGTGGSGALSIVVQPDQKILLGGGFSSYSGSTVSGMVRLNTNGTRDLSFNPSSDFSSAVQAMALQSDQKIVAVGSFSAYSGSAANGIIRLNSDGTRDLSFNTGTGFAGGAVRAVGIQSDGKILAGGLFTSYSGSSINRIIRLNTNGTIDSSFNVGVGFDAAVRSLVVQSDDKTVVVGNYTTYSGSAQVRMVRLNTDGTKDSSLNVGSGFGGTVRSVALQSDGKILAGGEFPIYNGITVGYSVLLESNGSIIDRNTAINNIVSAVVANEFS